MNERTAQALGFFTSKGWTQEQAAGIVGNLLQESGLRTDARNPGDGRDGTDSIGIAQWNSGRARGLRRFAEARGTSATDFATQLEFVQHELETSESGAAQALRGAATVDDATAAFIGFERPHGWSPEKVRQTLAEQSVEVNGVRVFGPGRAFPRDFAPALEGHLEAFAESNGAAFGIKSGSDLFIADTGDRTGTYAIMRKDGGYPVGRLTQADVDSAVRDYADAGTRRAAAWGRSVEENGRVVAFLKWMGNGFEVDGGNLTTAEAEAFLADREEQARIDAWLSRQAQNDGVNRDAFSGKWFRTGRFGGTQEVRPEVTWSDAEKGVVWRAAE